MRGQSSSRFPVPESKKNEGPVGTRGPQGKRLTVCMSTGSLPLDAFKSLANPRRGNRNRETVLQIHESSEEAVKGAHGRLCYLCGSETDVSGKGLRQCPECHSIQLQSGMMSHAYAVLHPNEGVLHKKGKGNNNDQVSLESLEGMGAKMNKTAARSAWSRMGQTVHEVLDRASPKMATIDQVPGAIERVPVPNTGNRFYTGDMVRTSLRLGRPIEEHFCGWDLLASHVDEGTVTGPGRKLGEVMVIFEKTGLEASMKPNFIEKINRDQHGHHGHGDRKSHTR